MSLTLLKPAVPGIYTNVPFSEYLAIDAVGSSSLRAMRRGPPARVLWEKENPSADTDETKRGSAVHCLFLQPELYDRTYIHKPEGMNFSTKEGKAWRDDPEHAGRKIISHDESILVGGAVQALLNKILVQESIENASHKEGTLVWKCPISGVLCKARPDWIEGRHIHDLKVSRHAEGKSLAYRAYMDGWMHQVAHYRTGALVLGLDVRGGRLAVVAPKPPHFVFTLEVKMDALDMLELENIATLRAMRECMERGEWDDTPETWEKIEPPASALVEFGEMTFEPEGEA